MYSAPAVERDSKKTDEVVVRDLRRSTTELQRDTLGIALVGFEPTASGVTGMYSEPAVGLVSLAGREKGVRHHLPERPGGCFAQMVPEPFFTQATRLWSDALLYR